MSNLGDMKSAGSLCGQLHSDSHLDGIINSSDHFITGGVVGMRGPKGDTGPRGPQGKQGPKGDPGIADYNELHNKPSINNVELAGNKSLTQLGLFTELDNIVLDCGTSTVNV